MMMWALGALAVVVAADEVDLTAGVDEEALVRALSDAEAAVAPMRQTTLNASLPAHAARATRLEQRPRSPKPAPSRAASFSNSRCTLRLSNSPPY